MNGGYGVDCGVAAIRRRSMQSGRYVCSPNALTQLPWREPVFEVHIDISLFTTTAAFGMISGTLPLPVVPQVGDTLSFRITRSVEAFCDTLPFNGLLRVTNRIISSDGVSVILEDLTAATPADAQSIIEILQENHRLFGDVWAN